MLLDGKIAVALFLHSGEHLDITDCTKSNVLCSIEGGTLPTADI
jgi:hypothetical protein